MRLLLLSYTEIVIWVGGLYPQTSKLAKSDKEYLFNTFLINIQYSVIYPMRANKSNHNTKLRGHIQTKVFIYKHHLKWYYLIPYTFQYACH